MTDSSNHFTLRDPESQDPQCMLNCKKKRVIVVSHYSGYIPGPPS